MKQFNQMVKRLAWILLLIAGISTAVSAEDIQLNADTKTIEPTNDFNNDNLKKHLEKISPRTSFRELENMLTAMTEDLASYPQNLDSRMMVGYVSLFLAEKYLQQKNFIKAAEFSKKGFYYIDEAAETRENDIKRRYFRLRIDAFIGNSSLRCPVAKSDTEFLAGALSDSSELKPMLTLLTATYASNCLDEKMATEKWQNLYDNKLFENEVLDNAKKNIAPKWQDVELALLFGKN
ncbi:hypothetical protein [Thorsellia kenyensis]|uniref:Uncharacterized protein n=1 Tax=Thorsellia kenyensis TaxID=1549888 RepID=A0ABV6CBB1_9GAMM